MNPQAILLNGAGLLNTVETEVDLFLSRNTRCKFSSNQIFNNLPCWLKAQIQSIAHSYVKGGCSSPASYVGTVAAMMAKKELVFHMIIIIIARFCKGLMTLLKKYSLSAKQAFCRSISLRCFFYAHLRR